MREIKFRGKTAYGNWVIGSLIINNFENYFIESYNKTGIRNTVLVIPETVGQFTGLHDKNGKEIYEGDTIGFVKDNTIAKMNFEVKYFKGGFWLSDRGYGAKLDPQLQDLENFAASDGYKTQIIGNIHDNPELLK